MSILFDHWVNKITLYTKWEIYLKAINCFAEINKA